ncbi:hypothetical protein F2Q69_00047926 [Brassica cretica]|uniref:Uncharacterized protein n=1 Tax=Brassica cretica TaxID=69181 RepID=A0A8S9PQ53_BRACR|nr:hypothetical protein F2Q69_00047926 [Brassica cretica]
MGSSPSSEGVLTGSGGCSEGLGLGLSVLSCATSIFGIYTRIFTVLQDAVDSVGVVDRCSDDPPGHAGLHCCPEQVSKAQPCLAVQYRSMGDQESVDGTGVWVDGG